jgi:archaellum component FlaC
MAKEDINTIMEEVSHNLSLLDSMTPDQIRAVIEGLRNETEVWKALKKKQKISGRCVAYWDR